MQKFKVGDVVESLANTSVLYRIIQVHEDTNKLTVAPLDKYLVEKDTTFTNKSSLFRKRTLFTQNHMFQIAEALSKEPENSDYSNAITNIANMLQEDDSTFDRTHFLRLTKSKSKSETTSTKKGHGLGDLFE